MSVVLGIVLDVLFTGYFIFATYKRREKLTCMTGMMIAMTIGMMSSLLLGLTLGILFKHDLTISTMISILFGLVAGYLTGKPISLMAALDGMLAGIMGGMMGAMLGVMLIVSEAMLLFMIIIFVVILSVLHQVIEEESGKAKADNKLLSKPLLVSMLTLVAGVLIVGALLLVQRQDIDYKPIFNQTESNSSGTKTEVQTTSEGNEGYQIGTINVTTSGYGSLNVPLKSGRPTKINFKMNEDAGCLSQIVSKDLSINAAILTKGDNFITLKDIKPGSYTFTCGMGMYSGSITIQS